MSSVMPASDLGLISTTERKSLLEQLKVLGREPANSESIFAKKVVLFCVFLVTLY